MKTIKAIIVCKASECDNDLYPVTIKNTQRYFCCKKGFEQSLKDFAESIKPPKQ